MEQKIRKGREKGERYRGEEKVRREDVARGTEKERQKGWEKIKRVKDKE